MYELPTLILSMMQHCCLHGCSLPVDSTGHMPYVTDRVRRDECIHWVGYYHLGYHMNKVGDKSDHGNVHPTEADYLFREVTEICHDGT